MGPWTGSWPEGEQWDEGLLRNGDRRNVADRYRYWTIDAIRSDLNRKRHQFHVAIENFKHDFNIGSVVRTANAFLAQEVHIVGHHRWNRRGAMVTDRYLNLRHHPTVEDLKDWAEMEGLPIIGIDNVPGSMPLETFSLPRRCVLFFGQEGSGLSQEALAASSVILAIAQYGSTRSINAGAAGAIAMHAWIRNHADLQAGHDR